MVSYPARTLDSHCPTDSAISALKPTTNAITFCSKHVRLFYVTDLHEKTIGSCHSTKWKTGLQLENN
jgi:hypothetical protein